MSVLLRLRVLVVDDDTDTAGFQMHVPKPIEPTELIAIVNSLAELRARKARHASG